MGSVIFFGTIFLVTGFFHIRRPTEMSAALVLAAGFLTGVFALLLVLAHLLV